QLIIKKLEQRIFRKLFFPIRSNDEGPNIMGDIFLPIQLFYSLAGKFPGGGYILTDDPEAFLH
ncbi:MAG: hypothetical protein ABIG63_07720, partial [Chloroflexota bacterium]